MDLYLNERVNRPVSPPPSLFNSPLGTGRVAIRSLSGPDHFLSRKLIRQSKIASIAATLPLRPIIVFFTAWIAALYLFDLIQWRNALQQPVQILVRCWGAAANS